MDILEQYLQTAAEIIGDRTLGEERYDREVVRWIDKGKSIRKALAKANDKFPSEALEIDESIIPDLQSRYEYLAEHERILRRLKKLQ